MTYYWRLGKMYVCPSKRPHCAGDNWKHTPKRDGSTGRFTGNRQHGAHVKDVYAGLPVWRCALAETGLTGISGDNYRQSTNSGYVGEGGRVLDFRHFVVSLGRLLLPFDMTVKTEGDRITLLWNDKRDIPSARRNDRLHVFFIRAETPDSLQRVSGLTATRSRGKASFILPDLTNKTYHLYPFFGSEGENCFSKNEYFEV